jgi:hypothetical protein
MTVSAENAPPPENGEEVEKFRTILLLSPPRGERNLYQGFSTFFRFCGRTLSAETVILPRVLRSTDMEVEDSGEVHLNGRKRHG